MVHHLSCGVNVESVNQRQSSQSWEGGSPWRPCLREERSAAPCLSPSLCATFPNFPAAPGGPRGPLPPLDTHGGRSEPLFGGKEPFLGLFFSLPLLERSSRTEKPRSLFFQLRSHGAPPFLCALLMRFFFFFPLFPPHPAPSSFIVAFIFLGKGDPFPDRRVFVCLFPFCRGGFYFRF